MAQTFPSTLPHEPELWSVKTIERATLIISTILLVVGGFFWPTLPVFGGLFAGVAIGYLNFRFIKRVVGRLLDPDKASYKKNGLRFLIKMLILIALVGTLILYLEVSPLAFLVGFSAFVLAIGYEGMKSIF